MQLKQTKQLTDIWIANETHEYVYACICICIPIYVYLYFLCSPSLSPHLCMQLPATRFPGVRPIIFHEGCPLALALLEHNDFQHWWCCSLIPDASTLWCELHRFHRQLPTPCPAPRVVIIDALKLCLSTITGGGERLVAWSAPTVRFPKVLLKSFLDQ